MKDSLHFGVIAECNGQTNSLFVPEHPSWEPDLLKSLPPLRSNFYQKKRWGLIRASRLEVSPTLPQKELARFSQCRDFVYRESSLSVRQVIGLLTTCETKPQMRQLETRRTAGAVQLMRKPSLASG